MLQNVSSKMGHPYSIGLISVLVNKQHPFATKKFEKLSSTGNRTHDVLIMSRMSLHPLATVENFFVTQF